MFSKLLLALALLLLAFKLGALKLGLRARLRELGRSIDRFVNIALVVIVTAYLVQLVLLFNRSR